MITDKDREHFRNTTLRRIFFDKKYREETREEFEKIFKESLKNLDFIKRQPKTYEMYETRKMYEGLLHVAGLFLEHCDKADEYEKKRQFKNRTFKLYKREDDQGFVFISSFYKVIEDKNKTNSLIGFEAMKRKVRITGKLLRRKINLDDYKLTDEGTFRMMQKSFDCITYIFTGRKTYRLKTTNRGNWRNNDLWFEIEELMAEMRKSK